MCPGGAYVGDCRLHQVGLAGKLQSGGGEVSDDGGAQGPPSVQAEEVVVHETDDPAVPDGNKGARNVSIRQLVGKSARLPYIGEVGRPAGMLEQSQARGEVL